MDKELAFMGRMTTGMTHEIKNVLAVIKESSGLIRDLLVYGEQTAFPHREQFLKITSTIAEQVQRGAELATRLNQFAHSVDSPSASLSVNELLNQLICLMQRHVRLKQVQLKVYADDQDFTICTDPFRLHLVLARCIEYGLVHVDRGGIIALRPRRTKEGPTIHVSWENGDGECREMPGPWVAPGHGAAEWEDILEPLGARISPSTQSGHPGLLLSLPPEDGRRSGS